MIQEDGWSRSGLAVWLIAIRHVIIELMQLPAQSIALFAARTARAGAARAAAALAA